MKLFIFLFLLAVQIYLTVSLPDIKDNYEKVKNHRRYRRFTCDVLAVFGRDVTRSACAVHCVMLGKHGGDCENAMCVCRNNNLVETWNQQFGHFYKFQ